MEYSKPENIRPLIKKNGSELVNGAVDGNSASARVPGLAQADELAIQIANLRG
jgi:hypothetical protein